MPSWDPASPGSRPSLYVELRRDGAAGQSGALAEGRVAKPC